MKTKQKPILYIHNVKSSFVDKDIEILSTEFKLSTFYFNVSPKSKVIPSFIKQLIFLFTHLQSEIYVIQFGGFHSLVPVLFAKLFNKKSIIILGGTDCVSFPSINYGNFNRKLLRIFTKISLKNAALLLPVDDTLIHYKYEYQKNDFENQGYKNFITSIKTPVKVIHNGYDSKKWNPQITQKEPNSFVTIGANLVSRFGVKLKGIDLIIEVAKTLSDCQFYIIGGKGLDDNEIPSNIHLLDKIPNQELANYLASKSFYLQLSMSEGFPNALCEAMLCGCIPIVSAVGAMPMIVGDTGFVLRQKEVTQLKKLIDSVLHLENTEALILKCRQRIIENFPIEKRRQELISAVQEFSKND